MDNSDLTLDMQEMVAQIAAMRAELTDLKVRASALLPQAEPIHPLKPLVSTTRRNTIKRLGLALLGGLATATALGETSVVQARIIANPKGNLANKAGMVVLLPGVAAPTGLAQGNYGLLASSDSNPFDLSSLPPGDFGIYGNSSYIGVSGNGLQGVKGTGSSIGVSGTGTFNGVYGNCTDTSVSSYGVSGTGPTGVSGQGTDTGVSGTGNSFGVTGDGAILGTVGVSAFGSYRNNNISAANSSVAVFANAGYSLAVNNFGPNTNVGLWVIAGTNAPENHASRIAIAAVFNGNSYFYGNVVINGNTHTNGIRLLQIDHPLDASNKYLYHAAVESPDLKNVYDGVVTLDQQGQATVELPSWFEAFNKDFRYQLTSVGIAAPNLHISGEIKDLQFKISGGAEGQKVCWQVTGIRQDAYAKANPIKVEEDKSETEKGFYLHPELYGQPKEKSVSPLIAK